MKKKINKKLNSKVKIIILAAILILTLVLTILNIINNSFCYLILLVFEILIIVFSRIKKYNLLTLDKLNIIKTFVLIATLVLGIFNIYFYINEIIVKILFSIIIILQVLLLLKINKSK